MEEEGKEILENILHLDPTFCSHLEYFYNSLRHDKEGFYIQIVCQFCGKEFREIYRCSEEEAKNRLFATPPSKVWRNFLDSPDFKNLEPTVNYTKSNSANNE